MATIEEDAEKIYAWLLADIAEGGGTGRRPWRVIVDGPWFGSDERSHAAMQWLVDAGRCRWEEIGWIGWRYLVPIEQP